MFQLLAITPFSSCQDTESRLWSQLYCPTDYRNCIGNKAATKQLFKWLDSWKTKLLNVKKRRE